MAQTECLSERADIMSSSMLKSNGCLQDFNERRHLLRLWIAPPVERPLPDAYLEIYGGSVEVGYRGGIKVAGFKPTVPLEAE